MMKYNMLNEYLKNRMNDKTKENEYILTKELTNNCFTEWNEKLECFTHICELYDYIFRFYEDGRIVMEDKILENTDCDWLGRTKCGHLEYMSVEEMLIDWLEEIKNNKCISQEERECITKIKIEYGG